MDPKNKYTTMQQAQYDEHALEWTVQNRDAVVGSFDAHNSWADYDIYLFKNIDTKDKIALDFACGPGRNIVKFSNRFKRIDGVDISNNNLVNAKVWCETNHIAIMPQLFKNNGTDLAEIVNDTYDVVFSTIAMQHICVHEIRYNLMKEFYRVLKPNGSICIQMGFGVGHGLSAPYHSNIYTATVTNGGADTRIEDPNDLKKDLDAIGFKNFEFDIRPVGPGDSHPNWIFFRATKN